LKITLIILTRYANEVEQNGRANFSQTFIIVDKMPETTKTLDAAQKSGSEIIQMSMQFWALELAKRLNARLGYRAEILSVPEDELSDYLEKKLAPIPILDFLNTDSMKVRALREEAQPYLLSVYEDDEDIEEDE